MVVPSQPSDNILRFKWISLTAGSIASFALFLVRLTSMAKEYQYGSASGTEGQSIFGVYQACLGKPIYPDLSVSVNTFNYNFLFYQLYGVLSRWVVGCNMDILLFGRMVTCTALLGTAVGLILPQNDQLTPSEKLFLFSLPFAPLIGWWAFAIRPDVIGMMFLTLALIVFRWALTDGTIKYIVSSAVLIFIAWAFKQPFIALAPVMFVFAIWYSVRGGLLFAAVVGVLLASVFVTLGFNNYVLHTITISGRHPILMQTMVANFEHFALKTSPVFLVALSVLIGKSRHGGIDRVDAFDAAALLFSGVAFFIAAGKLGAGDYYYFPVYVIAILIVAKGIPDLAPRERACVLALGGLNLVAICLVYLTGTAGRMTLDVNRAQVRKVEESLAAAPRPKLVIDEFFALPWISGDPEQPVFDFVLDYENNAKRIPGSMSLEREIANGVYATIATPGTLTKNFDLHRYRMDRSINDFQIWTRLEQ